MLLPGGGGGGTTIVINPEDLRQTSAAALQVAEGYHVLAGRLRSRPLPEMPPDIAGRVSLELSEACCLLNSEPPILLETARELRVRAFWADVADRMAAGYELEGAQLAEFKAGMASGILLRYASAWEQELGRKYFEELKEREDPGGFAGFVKDVAGGVADFFEGAWDSIKDPAVMLYHLTPFSEDWTERWQELGSGLAYAATHPLEFGRAALALDALDERGVAYWLGNLAPSVAAAVLTGGGSAAVRGAGATARIADKADDLTRAARSLDRAGDALSTKPEWLRRLDQGNDFNVQRRPFYEHNELYVNQRSGTDYFRVDSYDTRVHEIVSRKFTQLGDVQENTAIGYLRELDSKYAPGTRIADVPSTPPHLRGSFLDGDMVLEVPVQSKPIPQSVLDEADRLNITIRDAQGRVYNP